MMQPLRFLWSFGIKWRALRRECISSERTLGPPRVEGKFDSHNCTSGVV